MATFVDNSKYVLDAFARQMGQAKVEIKDVVLDSILDQMMTGYKEPHGEDGHTEIYDTGALYGSVKVEDGGTTFGSGLGASVGSYGWTLTASANTEYASYVHQGTYKLNGRPFITDGVQRVQYTIKQIIQKHGRG